MKQELNKKYSEDSVPKATHTGEIKIGDVVLACAVLSDGTRLLTQKGFLLALGRSPKPKGKPQQSADGLPPFLATRSLIPLITEEIRRTTAPVDFETKNGRRALGYKAELLPIVCDIFLQARQERLLTEQQMPLADNAELLTRALSKVGIIALVDEATGFQADRDRNELHKLLAVYLSEDRLAWAKRFPDEFYEQIYRLRGWSWPTGQGKTPYIGKITNAIVYDRLLPGVLEKLRLLNPTVGETKRRKHKHHQYLSADIGQPDLRDHLLQLLPIMRLSDNWSDFETNLQRALPGSGQQLLLSPEDEGKAEAG